MTERFNNGLAVLAAIAFTGAIAVAQDPADTDSTKRDRPQIEKPGVGFAFADADQSGQVSAKELRTYLRERIQAPLPHQKIFDRLDDDGSGQVTESEFENRHDVITHFMGSGFLGGTMHSAPVDPGKSFVPFKGLDQEIDDRSIFGAVYHRYFESLGSSDSKRLVDLKSVPEQLSMEATRELLAAGESAGTVSVEQLVKASAIIAGGGHEFFTAGAVVVSPDGLALTNYHVAESMADSELSAMAYNGKTYRVSEFLAGNRERDVAVVRLDCKGYRLPFVAIAKAIPNAGDDIEMIHHSENRFFTYDRGYVMRFPKVGEHPWMEISADYAPGGSGCGIFNQDRELVGLVSIIQYGDGPSLAIPMDDADSDYDSDEDFDSDDNFGSNGLLLVKQAVSLQAIQALLNPSKDVSADADQEDSSPKTQLLSEKTQDQDEAAEESTKEGNRLFQEPVALKLNGKPINQDGHMPYPSPAIFDVDNDGQLELVVGDLTGALTVFETKEPKLTTEWSERHSIEGTSDSAISLSNW